MIVRACRPNQSLQRTLGDKKWWPAQGIRGSFRSQGQPGHLNFLHAAAVLVPGCRGTSLQI